MFAEIKEGGGGGGGGGSIKHCPLPLCSRLLCLPSVCVRECVCVCVCVCLRVPPVCSAGSL